MYKKVIYAVLHGLILLVTAGLAQAEINDGANEVKLSFTGNTVAGKIIKRDISYKMYFHPSGKLIRLTGKENPEKGLWRINSNDALCMTFASEQCYKVTKRGEAIFDLLDQNGDRVLSVEKVILGNPDKLKP